MLYSISSSFFSYCLNLSIHPLLFCLMLSHLLLCFAKPSSTFLSHSLLSYPIPSFPIISHLIATYYIPYHPLLLYTMVSCLFLYYPIQLRHILSFPISLLCDPIPSSPLIPYLILSYTRPCHLILSYFIQSHFISRNSCSDR